MRGERVSRERGEEHWGLIGGLIGLLPALPVFALGTNARAAPLSAQRRICKTSKLMRPGHRAAGAELIGLAARMGTTYRYTNLTKREWFSARAFGENDKLSGLGRSLSSRAFDLLLVKKGGVTGAGGVVQIGYWAGDSVALIGDDDGDWHNEFVDLDADVILLVYAHDGFEDIAVAAERDECLFVQLCYLVASHQAPQLEPHMKQQFGGGFLRRYKQLSQENNWFHPKNIGRPPARG